MSSLNNYDLESASFLHILVLASTGGRSQAVTETVSAFPTQVLLKILLYLLFTCQIPMLSSLRIPMGSHSLRGAALQNSPE